MAACFAEILLGAPLLQGHDDRTLGGEDTYDEERKPTQGGGRKRLRGRGPQVRNSGLWGPGDTSCRWQLRF